MLVTLSVGEAEQLAVELRQLAGILGVEHRLEELGIPRHVTSRVALLLRRAERFTRRLDADGRGVRDRSVVTSILDQTPDRGSTAGPAS